MSKRMNNGERYGYPKCCVEWFAKAMPGVENPEYGALEDTFGFVGTGYRPCPTCVKTKTIHQLYHEICANRKDPSPFPMTSEDVQELKDTGPRNNYFTKVFVRFHVGLGIHNPIELIGRFLKD